MTVMLESRVPIKVELLSRCANFFFKRFSANIQNEYNEDMCYLHVT